MGIHHFDQSDFAELTPSWVSQRVELDDAYRDWVKNPDAYRGLVRNIRHLAYPKAGSFSASKAHMRKLAWENFQLSTLDDDSPHSLVLEHISELTTPDFDMLTVELDRFMECNGWYYDGWNCSDAGSRSTSCTYNMLS